MPKTSFKKYILKVSDKFSTIMKEKTEGILPEEAAEDYRKNLKKIMAKSFKELGDRIQRAFLIIAQLKILDHDTLKNMEGFVKKQIKKTAKQDQELSLLEMTGLDLEQIKPIYSAAILYFGEKEYEKSADLFFLLVNLIPDVYDFWYGFALAEEQKGELITAFSAFDMASKQSDEKLLATVKAADCLYRSEQYEEGDLYLFQVIQDIEERGKSEEFEDVLKEIYKLAKKYGRHK